MCLRVFIVGLVTVSAGRIDQQFRDHVLAVPKTDFGSDRDFDGFGRAVAPEPTSFVQLFGGIRQQDPPFEQKSFQTELRHREYEHRSDGQKTNHEFTSRNFGTESHGGETHHRRDFDTQFPTNVNGNRRNFGSFDQGLGSDVRREIFDENTHGIRSINNEGSDFQTSRREFQNRFGSEAIGSNFQGRRIDSNHRSVDNRFNDESELRRRNQFESFGGEDMNSESGSKGRNVDARHIDEQINKHKKEFEIISTDNKRRSETEHTGTLDSVVGVASNYQNGPASGNGYPQNKNTASMSPNKGTNHNSETNTQSRSSGGHQDSNTSSKNDVKTTTENEIPHKTVEGNANKTVSRTEQGGEEKDDRWIWGMENANEVTTTAKPPDSVDDRAAFAGSKCPAGKVKINETCVDYDR